MTLDFNSLTLQQIRSVYSGKNGRCCCGCSGTHYYTQHGKKSEYETVDENKVNNAIKLFQKHATEIDKISDTCYSLIIGKKLYVIYLNGHNC